jgi:SAM-dependent methyltransferase
MTQDDLDFVAACLQKGLVRSPCLEVGVSGEHNTRDLLSSQGIEYFGADLGAEPGVHFQVDLGRSFAEVDEVFRGQTFKTVMLLNVLEHTFEPIRVLDNVFALLDPDGVCVITTPVVWPLHDYPVDCWRINPNFYERYCESRSLHLFDDMFQYLKYGPVRNGFEAYSLPAPARGWRHFYSRGVHKVFNTTGRGMVFPSHISLGVVIGKSPSEGSGDAAKAGH